MPSWPPSSVPRKHVPKVKDEVVFHHWQLDGIREMLTLQSFILADDMGLGKTLQAATVAAVAFKLGHATRILIVTPATLKENWADDLDEHLKFTWHILDGTPAQRTKQLDTFDSDVLIINYEQVKSHVDKLNAMKFDIIIYDEGHILRHRPVTKKAAKKAESEGKAPKGTSQRAIATMKLRAPRHFVLTGSPMLNQIDDLWSVLHRVAPDEFPDYWRFVNRYAVYGGFQDKQIVGVKNEKELRERLQKYMIRRVKRDVMVGWTEPQRITIKLDMHPEQRALYQRAKEEMKMERWTGEFTDDGEMVLGDVEIKNPLSKLLYLKMICNTTASIPGHDDHSTKLDRVVEMCHEFVNTASVPVVVWTQFRGTLACMERRFQEHKPPIDYVTLHGGVPKNQRMDIVRGWTDAAGAGHPQVFLSMLQIGGTGLNLVAASRMIFIDKLFVPLLNQQAIDREDRIGQTETVQVWEFEMRKSVEQRVNQILKQKNTIFGAVVEVDSSGWKKKLMAAVMEEEDWE